MADADALIASLRAEGEATAVGGFTLDPVKAREKMREFQLADPQRYVLLVLQAMVVRGATAIHVDIDTNDLHIRSDARPFTHDELVNLYALLFADAAPAPGLRELALGLNAAMATDPRWLRLECGAADGREGVRLEQRNDAPDRVERLGAVEPGVRLQVRERFRAGLITRFFALGSDVTREQVLVRQHCGFAGIPITLGGKAVPQRSAGDDVEAWHDVTLHGRVIGKLGLSPTADKGTLQLVRHHVWLLAHVFDNPMLRGVRGVIDVSELRTDVSMGDVVRDEAYNAILSAVHQARDVALAAAARAHPDGGGLFASDMRELLCARIGMCLRAKADPERAPLRDLLGVTLWAPLAGPRCSSAALLAAAKIRYSSVDAREVPPEVADVIFAKGRAAELLTSAFGERCEDASQAVTLAITRASNRRAFEGRLHACTLPVTTAYHERVAFDEAAMRGVIGWAPNAGPSWIRLLIGGRLAVELPFNPELTTIHVVIEASFEHSDLFDDVRRDDTFMAAMRMAMVAYAAIARVVAVRLLSGETLPGSVLDDILRYLAASSDDTHVVQWLASGGVGKAEASALLERDGPPWRLDVARDLGDDPHPFGLLPLFEDATGAAVSLRRIALAVRDDGHVRVITPGRPKLREAPMFVVRTGERRLKLLESLFGERSIKRAGREYEQWLTRERFTGATSPEELTLHGPIALGPIAFRHDGNAGVIGVVANVGALASQRTAQVRVFVESRPIAQFQPVSALPGIEAAVSVDLRWLNPSCDGLVPRGVVAAHTVLATGHANLFERIIAVGDELSPELRTVVLDAVALACPAPAYMQAWMAMRRELELSQATRLYIQLLRLGDSHEPAAVHDAVLRQLRRDELPHPGKIGQGLDSRERAPWSLVRVAAAERLSRLLQIAVIPAAGGQLLPLQALIDTLEATKQIGYLEPTEDVPAEFAALPMLDDRLESALGELFGATALDDRRREVERLFERSAFERRPPLAELAPTAGTAVVAVDIEADGVRGVLGVPRRLPQGAGEVTVCCDRRPITTVDPMPGTAWIGIVDGDGFGVEDAYRSITRRELARITEICEAHRTAIIRALCRDALAGNDGDIARCWVQHLLRQVLPPGAHDQAALGRAGLHEIAGMRLFVDAEGHPHTLGELRAHHDEFGALSIVRRAGLRTDRMLVHVRDDAEAALLQHLFGELVDAEPIAERREAFEARMRAAPAMPTVPSDAYAIVDIEARALIGQLWLSAGVDDAATISLGRDGRVIDQWRGSTMFPCAGAVTGAGVELAADFSGAELTRAREDHLKSRAAQAYIRLVASVRDAWPPPDDPRTRLLRALVLRLHEIRRASRPWPSHEMRRLYRDLRDAPLLSLANGRAISLRAAEQSRPRELAALGLFEVRDDEVDDAANAGDDAERDADAAITAAPAEAPPAPTPPPAAAPVEPTPAPVALPEPVPAPPTEILRDRIVAELRLLRQRDLTVLDEAHLDGIWVEALDGARIARRRDTMVVIDSAHPVVRRALDADADPLLVSLLASAAFSALNLALDELTDAQESRLLRLHAEHLRTAAHALR